MHMRVQWWRMRRQINTPTFCPLRPMAKKYILYACAGGEDAQAGREPAVPPAEAGHEDVRT